VFIDGGLAQRKLYLHQLKTKKLQPSTLYSYQVGSITDNKYVHWSPEYEFHTASKKNDFSFIATGDVVRFSQIVDTYLFFNDI
jgi:hypothetical protein